MSYTTTTTTKSPSPSPSLTSSSPRVSRDSSDGGVAKTVSENAVIAFGRRGCCMCHVIRRFLQGLGVIRELMKINCGVNEVSGCLGDGGMIELPAVFVGGKLFGGVDKVMSTHISGELVPVLKEAGALWL